MIVAIPRHDKSMICASAPQNLQQDLSDQRSLRSPCASAKSNQSFHPKTCHNRWMYMLICVFTGLIVDFVVRWLIYKYTMISGHHQHYDL